MVESLLYSKMPLWVSPLETISDLLSFTSRPLVYANLLDNGGTLKSLQQLKQEGSTLNW